MLSLGKFFVVEIFSLKKEKSIEALHFEVMINTTFFDRSYVRFGKWLKVDTLQGIERNRIM